MSSPYREVGDLVHEVEITDQPQPLVTYDVSGKPGAGGRHGSAGSSGHVSGADGAPGGDAGPAMPGESAGQIRLELVADDAAGALKITGELVTPMGAEQEVMNFVVIDEHGFIPLRAIGGDGGRGGNGGRGGDGARGHDGADATRWTSGSDGGDGGDGGRGGGATSGAPGGAGGRIVVAVADHDTPLLMLLRHDVEGGAGGLPGSNGVGGSGGAGGRGGDSYSWTTTSTYRDSNGNTQTRTHHHRNAGGSNGSSGSSGGPGDARVREGARGADGRFAIQVTTGDTTVTYPSRYDLRLVSFAHDSLNEDAVYEPRELVRVFDLEVENTGGMPTPSQDDLALALAPGGWVKPEPGELRCIRGLEPGGRYKVPGELRFRIADHTPDAPGEPLEVEESIHQRAMLPSVRREFAAYQEGDSLAQGSFVIRYPVRVSAVDHLRSLAPGEGSRVRFEVTNQSRFALGAASACARVVRVRVSTAPDSELGDEHVVFFADDQELAPDAGWTHELTTLPAGETAVVELVVRVREGAPEYLRFAAHVTLELGELEAPATVRPIQLRGFDVRVARPFQVSDADIVLVVNHRTTREEIEAWQHLGERLAFTTAIWDLTRERHLDLERPLADGIALADWFAHKAIVILDNEIEGPDGPTYPHVFLAEDQAARAAARGIDIAFVGKGLALERVLVPAGESATTMTIHRTYWLRWWAKPSSAWLEKQARKLSAKLAKEQPAARHIVIHRHAPELDGTSAWMNRWKAGTLEIRRTLDAAAGALVHAAVDERDLHDPAYAASDHATTTLLVMFELEENIERVRRLLARAEVTEAELGPITDALILDLANELDALLAPGWMGETSGLELELQLHRLEALSRSGLTAAYESAGGAALRRLAGRLMFLARSQVRWWENVPPLLWMRRGPHARRRIAEHVQRFLEAAFGAHDAVQAGRDVEVIAHELERQHAQERKIRFTAPRRPWASSRHARRSPRARSRATPSCSAPPQSV